MTFTIAGHNAEGGISHRRDTAVEAIQKAAEMECMGMTDVYITDTATGRAYCHEEFPVLLILNVEGAVPAERATKSAD